MDVEDVIIRELPEMRDSVNCHNAHTVKQVWLTHWGKNKIADILAWWRHQMETFSVLLAICAGNSPVLVNSPHKGQWGGALMFSLICTRINGWVNNGEAGDLRCHRAHYDVIVMGRTFPSVKFVPKRVQLTVSQHLSRMWLGTEQDGLQLSVKKVYVYIYIHFFKTI